MNDLDQLRHEFGGWSTFSNQLVKSDDLFSFAAPDHLIPTLESLHPGDHIALYPNNLYSTADFVLRMAEVTEELTCNVLCKEFDLTKPLSDDELKTLEMSITNGEARTIFQHLVANLNCNSIEILISQLPPGTISTTWIVSHAPKISPRFYSITSISEDHKVVSIFQSTYIFPETKKTGLASRWLRSLKGGDPVEAKFSSTDFRLPLSKKCPILMIATGSGIGKFFFHFDFSTL
jgi:sulfite reductase alpha subunit-like flavoprotein